jgi:integrase
MRSSEIHLRASICQESNATKCGRLMGQKRHNCWRTSGTRLFIPVLLGVLCGLRRGQITALRWRSVDLARGQMSIVESTQQTRRGIRYKEQKMAAREQSPSPLWPSVNCENIACAKLKSFCGLGDALRTRLTLSHRKMPNHCSRTVSRTNLCAYSRSQRFYRKSAFMMHFANGVHPKVVQERLTRRLR